MFEDHQCTDCSLHRDCKHRCLPSIGEKNCKVAIFLDYPAMIEDKRNHSWVGTNAEFVLWCLKRMGVGLHEIYLDYILKCYPAKGIPKKKDVRRELVDACRCYREASMAELLECKVVVGLGTLCGEVLTGYAKIGEIEGSFWRPIEPFMRSRFVHVWIGYNPGYVMEKPGESGGVYRVLWKACEEAGLNPAFQKDVKPFNYPD